MTKTKLRGLLSPLLRRLRIREVARFVGENKKILDAGCDDASLINSIKKIKHYTGIDINKKLIEQNISKYAKYKNIEFKQVDLNKKIRINLKYDVVVLSAVIEHINNFNNLLSNIKEITEKNSRIIITTPAKKSDLILKLGAVFGIFSKESLDEHEHYFSYKDFTNLKDWKLKKYCKFECGLNQLIILEKNDDNKTI
jgi:2-polyprenyl-3-methyl-5-hydroxy-6-metoxy-1,4-benzoquinol methylase